MSRRKVATVLFAAALLAGCSEEVQVHQHIGTVTTAAGSPTSAEVSFEHRGRWILFQLVDNAPAGDWPLPFRADLLDHAGRLVVSRTIDATKSDPGSRILSWEFDQLHGPKFQSNLDAHGNLPLDRVLRQGQRYTLRLTFPPQSTAHRYEVVLLASRRLYPWQYREV